MKTVLGIIFRWGFALLFIGGGINHLRNPAFYLRMMPDYLPLHNELVLISGIIEFVLGILFLIPRTSKLANVGLLLLLLAVFPANIHMAVHPQDFSEFPVTGLWLRLPLQGLLLWWGYSYLKSDRSEHFKS